MPETDIFVARLGHTNGKLSLGAAKNMTHRAGYDNQPNFSADGRSFLFTEYLDGQSDIFGCYMQTDSIQRLTNTRESEYSPTMMPDGEFYSVIRVEKDSTQRLWKFPIGGGEPELVLKSLKPVGYHAWLDNMTVALFILGDTNTLNIVNINTEAVQRFPGEIGRSMHKIPQRNTLSFVQKVSEKEWWIKEYNPKTKTMRPLIKTLAGKEDFTWTPDGMIVMGEGSKLYYWNPETSPTWQLLGDCSEAGISEITRLDVSPLGDMIAIVGITTVKK